MGELLGGTHVRGLTKHAEAFKVDLTVASSSESKENLSVDVADLSKAVTVLLKTLQTSYP